MDQLPDTALVTMLQAVPQCERLRDCAHVSTAWAGAAASATTDVVACFKTRACLAAFQAFQAWLDKHAGQLVSLRSSFGESLVGVLRLPYAKLARLQTLELAGPRWPRGNVELVWQPTQAGSTSNVLPALRAFKLSRVRMPISSLEVLQQAQQLTALEIADCTIKPHESPGSGSDTSRQCAAAVSALLRCLPQLSELRLRGMDMSDDTLAPLSSLQHLQALTLTGSSFAARVVLSLPSALTALHLDSDYDELVFPLSALAQLTRLRSLQLGSASLADVALSAFSALTASSHISSISLGSLGSDGEQPLPRGALQHTFAGRSLPHLRKLCVGPFEGDNDLEEDPDVWCVDAADLDTVAAACSGLQCLSLCGVLRNEPRAASSIAGHQQLTQLRLRDTTGWLTDEAAATLSSQLPSLRELVVWFARDLTDVGLLYMTALRQLTRLYCSAYSWSMELESICGTQIKLETPAEANAPDVWRQLAELLRRTPAVTQLLVPSWLAIHDTVEGLRAELAVARAELSRLRGGADPL